MNEVCGDIESVRRHVQAAGWRRLGIDGVDGESNAHLARALARTLHCPVLDLDDYLHRNQGGYVDFIDYPALAGALSSIPAFILSGVCLREVLVNAGATLDANIYVKRMNQGIWTDEEGCEFPEGIDVAIETLARNRALNSRYLDELPEQAGQVGDDTLLNFADEIMRYHDAHRPQETADLVFERDNAID